jgi:hypothetical protein
MSQYCTALLDQLLNKLKQQLVSKYRGKHSKGIMFLQNNAAPHKASITYISQTYPIGNLSTIMGGYNL